MQPLREPARDVPVVCEADLCVIGGSCTGVFAAVRAARLGLRVALIENHGFLGGVATAGLVSIWHSVHDVAGRQAVIGGLTAETLARLERRDAVQRGASPHAAYVLNTEELKIELDELVREAGVRPFLHTRFVAPWTQDGRLAGVIVEDKTGRRALCARFFIDATGDGDLVHRLGLPTVTWQDLQPPTACAVLEGLARVAAASPGFRLSAAVFNQAFAGALPLGFLWSAAVPGADDLTMVAGSRVNHANCADADQLTAAEIEGRRQVRAMLDVLRQNLPRGREVFLRELPAQIGIRETRHAGCLHTLTETELLHGVRFPDAIANGTYRVDVHHSDKPGLTFRYLDGREEYVVPGQPTVNRRWRPVGDDGASFYQIPYRALVPRGSTNVLVAGRLLDADRGAYGAVRVMVTCNQTGEAAGVAAVLALQSGCSAPDVPSDRLRATLAAGGSILP